MRNRNDSSWYRERSDGMEEVAFRLNSFVYRGRSRYQQIDIVDSVCHGRMLFLDQVLQSSQKDEFIYHEMLVHPALCSHSEPRTVLILGGAEGATLREVLRHPSVRRVVMVEIDEKLVAACQSHLWAWHQGSYEDPRLRLIIGDGRRYLEQTTDRFDAILVDLSDPLPDSPAVFLFTREFYRLVRRRLTAGGFACIQGEAVSPQEMGLHVRMVTTLRAVFPLVRPCWYFMPSFHRPDAHILVGTRWADRNDGRRFLVKRLRQARLPLRYLSPAMAESSFTLPPYLTAAYDACRDLITDRRPYLENAAIRPVVRGSG